MIEMKPSFQVLVVKVKNELVDVITVGRIDHQSLEESWCVNCFVSTIYFYILYVHCCVFCVQKNFPLHVLYVSVRILCCSGTWYVVCIMQCSF